MKIMGIIWTQTTLMLETEIQITSTTKELKNLRQKYIKEND